MRRRFPRGFLSDIAHILYLLRIEVSAAAAHRYFTMREVSIARKEFQPKTLIGVEPNYQATVD